MEFIAIQALVLHSLPEEWRTSELPRLVFDEFLPPLQLRSALRRRDRASETSSCREGDCGSAPEEVNERSTVSTLPALARASVGSFLFNKFV